MEPLGDAELKSGGKRGVEKNSNGPIFPFGQISNKSGTGEGENEDEAFDFFSFAFKENK